MQNQVRKVLDICSEELDYYTSNSNSRPEVPLRKAIMLAKRTLSKCSPKNSPYAGVAAELRAPETTSEAMNMLADAVAALEGLLLEMKEGWVESFANEITTRNSESLLVQSKELFNSGYHIGAMVLAGASLEQHLRMISPASMNELKVSSLLDEMVKIGVIAHPLRSSLKSAYDLRNSAAHGKVDEVSSEQVAIAISKVEHALSTLT